MWFQQLAEIGLISLNNLNTLENVAEEYRSINQNYWNQRIAAVERLLVFHDGENESLEDDVHNFVDRTTRLTTAVLRRGVEMNILSRPYLHRPP